MTAGFMFDDVSWTPRLESVAAGRQHPPVAALPQEATALPQGHRRKRGASLGSGPSMPRGRVSSLFVLFASGAVGFLPLLGGPGYENSLAAGFLIPPVAAISTAIHCARARPEPLAALAWGATQGVWLGALWLLISLLHGVRVGFCSLPQGLLLFVLGPWCGALVGGGWGALAGSIAGRWVTPWRRDVLAVVLALAGPAASALASGLRFFTSPMVFAFDPFVGFFSGTLYDTVIDGSERLFSYRLGTLASWGAAVGVATHLGSWRWRGWSSALPLISLTLSLIITARGPSFGHYQTEATIREALGGVRKGEFCEVVHPATMRPQEADLFLRDCEQQLAAVSSFLGLERCPVTAFLFMDASQKRRLMGASDTYVAKPWRREVYVQASGYPHPVLGHELAHVVAGQAARGPFKVAGSLGGIIPDPGLVEGIAVAAAPEEDELSPESWSRAMLELGLLPPLSSIFSFRFYGHHAERAYTVAGAFVAWVRLLYGPEALRRWYGGESLSTITGRSWALLEEDFRSYLQSLPLPPEALAVARARFDRPSVFQRRCPHEVDAYKRNALDLLASGDIQGALRSLDAVAFFAPQDPGAALLRATCLERSGNLEASSTLLHALLKEPGLAPTFAERVEERLGDLALQRGAWDEAARRYGALLGRVLDEDQLRTLEIKLLAVRSPLARPAVQALLVGTPGHPPELALATEELARWAERSPEDGTPLYLLGRNALARGYPERAAMQLDLALNRTFPHPRIAREAARQRVLAGCVLQDPEGIARGLSAWEVVGSPPGHRGDLLRALAARCRAATRRD
ncbi:MAG: hypothetical protein RMJ98_18250 [Myxococcales bacterium]|nr:hypothetical protein [Polyangiaceae bacterium]MDW8251241.1 hypothetical protein [Myxococcales bacterium]